MDFVKMYLITKQFEPYRLFVSDKMDLMSPAGQCDAQLSCNNTTTSKCWVTLLFRSKLLTKLVLKSFINL